MFYKTLGKRNLAKSPSAEKQDGKAGKEALNILIPKTMVPHLLVQVLPHGNKESMKLVMGIVM